MNEMTQTKQREFTANTPKDRDTQQPQGVSSSQLNLQTNPAPTPAGAFVDISKLFLQFRAMRDPEQPPQHGRGSKLEDWCYPTSNPGGKATVTQTVWDWPRHRDTDQRNRMQSPETDPCHTVTDLTKGTKATQWGQDSLSNKWCRNSWTSTCTQTNLDTDLTAFTKITSN